MKYYEKALSCLCLFLLILGLVPIVILGHYNHPTGDDYHYGVETHHIWEATHDIAQVLGAACKGVSEQYEIWQGTYSAMFLMYLPPNAFSERAYHFVTPVILLLLCGSIFYLSNKILRGWLNASASAWIAISSVTSMLWIQTVNFQSESFFWYNGSMYYTGFLAITLFFFGLLSTWLQRNGLWRIPLLCLLAFILAGGNYVTFLPATILFTTLAGILLHRQNYKRLISLLPVYLFWFGGFAVNALAPGNQVRQDGMWQISPILAILKSLREGIDFLLYMTNLWFVIALLLITPLLWHIFRQNSFSFRYPVVMISFAYGVMCSAFCPTFYTMNSTGPARAVAVMYYMYVLFVLLCYAYGLGYVQRIWRKKRTGKATAGSNKNEDRIVSPGGKSRGGFYAAILLLLTVQGISGAWRNCTAARAIRCLVSGDAAAYEAEYRERMVILADPSVKTVVFHPYEVQADLLYVGDLTGEPEHPTNQQVAEYFDKESVCVKWE